MHLSSRRPEPPAEAHSVQASGVVSPDQPGGLHKVLPLGVLPLGGYTLTLLHSWGSTLRGYHSQPMSTFIVYSGLIKVDYGNQPTNYSKQHTYSRSYQDPSRWLCWQVLKQRRDHLTNPSRPLHPTSHSDQPPSCPRGITSSWLDLRALWFSPREHHTTRIRSPFTTSCDRKAQVRAHEAMHCFPPLARLIWENTGLWSGMAIRLLEHGF